MKNEKRTIYIGDCGTSSAADPDQQYDDIVERRLFPAGDNEDVFLTRIAASRERLPLKEAA